MSETAGSAVSQALWEETAACGVCGSYEWRAAGVICTRRYATCRGCGVVRLYDRVAEQRLDLLYGAGYYAGAEPSRADLEEQLRNPTFGHRLVRLEQCVRDRERRLLEVGCGDGNFLAVLRRAGWNVHGQEFSADTAEVVRRRHDIPVIIGDLADVAIGRPFAVVCAYHVLEHVYHPARWMQRVRDLIEPDGLLHLQVPNAGSLTAQLTGAVCASLVFPQHVYGYTPATLAALLGRFGFTVLTMTTWDPWHGPGTVSRTLFNVVTRLVEGRLPWNDDLTGRAGSAAAVTGCRPAPGPVKKFARRVLEGVSAPLARMEAAAGRGAVVDVIAVRRGDAGLSRR